MPTVVITAGLLWFLLALFHEGSNYEVLQQQSITLILMVSFVGWLAGVLAPGLWIVAMTLQIVTLYFGIDWLCGYSKKTNHKIIVSFFGLQLIGVMIIYQLS